jgi:hypothetical protein
MTAIPAMRFSTGNRIDEQLHRRNRLFHMMLSEKYPQKYPQKKMCCGFGEDLVPASEGAAAGANLGPRSIRSTLNRMTIVSAAAGAPQRHYLQRPGRHQGAVTDC